MKLCCYQLTRKREKERKMMSQTNSISIQQKSAVPEKGNIPVEQPLLQKMQVSISLMGSSGIPLFFNRRELLERFEIRDNVFKNQNNTAQQLAIVLHGNIFHRY
mmetsp:Transcript_5332/g.8240  ORF Transcript_5332/g.8240 Transcript_5332/m.8240 type:complete len:104 (-) Transcript_5332:168-479(-)